MKKIIPLLLVFCLLLSLAACKPEPGSQTGPAPELREDCSHTDRNSDEYCDLCGGNVVITLQFYAINDLHGRFSDTDQQPGLDELSTYLEALDDSTTVLLSSGDMWQGTSESNLTYGAMMTEWMNEMDFASMTLGNHEFDWGEEYIEANRELAQFPFLAINIYSRDSDAPVDYCAPSILIERSGVQIGIIGAIGDCYGSIAADQVSDIYFKTGEELTELVKAESQRLREQGADIIVYSLHDGGTGRASLADYYDLSLSEGYVDLVFEGHSHSQYNFEDREGVHHVQCGAENKGMSWAVVKYNIVTGRPEVNTAYVLSNKYDNSKPHAIVEQLLEKYQDQISAGDTVLGQNSTLRDGYWLRELTARLYYETGVALWGSEYDITLGGGYLSIRSPGELAAGDVRYEDLYSLFPFDNGLVLCSVQGSDLIEKFLETDNENYFVYCEESEEVDPEGTYYILVDTYTSTYAPNNLTEIQRYDQPVYARDLLADYIAAGNLAE